MDGHLRLRKDIWTRALFVLLVALAFLSLGAVFSQPARADLIEAVIDPVEDAIETTTTTVIDPGVVEDEGDEAAPLEEVLVEVVPPVVEEVIEVVTDVPAAADEALEVVNVVPPVVEDLLNVVEDVPPVVEETIEVVEAVVPVVEILEDVPPIVEVVDPVVDDIVKFVPPLVLDVVQVFPVMVFDVVESPGPIDVPIDPVVPTNTNPRPVSLATEIAQAPSRQSSGMFDRQLVAEMAQVQTADLTNGVADSRSPSSPIPNHETRSLAAYVPTTGPLPVAERGAGAAGPSGSSHSGSGFFGGLDAFSFFAALAALLALCLVGWIRDRSRSGRSIFPSHGGRPG